MEFTDSYKQTGPSCFSPNARFIAVAVDYRLVIRDTLSVKVAQVWFVGFVLFLRSMGSASSFCFFVWLALFLALCFLFHVSV